MGIGHLAVGLALKKSEPRLNSGWLVFGAFLPDFLLGLFALAGIEQYQVPPDYSSTHYLTFTFPYSHGLLATSLWAVLFALLASRFLPRGAAKWTTAARVCALAVLSHFFLDAIVHVPELPLAGPDSYRVGLGLWNHLALELLLEVAMVIGALVIYMKSTQVTDGRGRYGMVVFVVLLTAVMISGQAFSTTPPTSSALIGGWIIAPVAISAVVFWLDRKRAGLAAGP